MTRKTARATACVLGMAVLLVAAGFFWFRSTPQIGADKDAFRTVDALFTAVTARDEKLLGVCERRLAALKGAGKLPADAADYLDGIVQRARSGRWESAAERLYDFMRAQRYAGK